VGFVEGSGVEKTTHVGWRRTPNIFFRCSEIKNGRMKLQLVGGLSMN
jgi:hypothetical protein